MVGELELTFEIPLGNALVDQVALLLTARLIPLTQVRLHVVAGRRRRSDFCSGFRAR
jgi:hypothetical protein